VNASNMSPSGALSISTWSIPVIGRSPTGFHMLHPVGWPTPYRRATYCRRLSSPVFHLYFRLRTFGSHSSALHRDRFGRRFSGYRDRSLTRGTSDRKKKLITPSRKWGNLRVAVDGKTTSWNLFGLEDRSNLSDRNFIRNILHFSFIRKLFVWTRLKILI